MKATVSSIIAKAQTSVIQVVASASVQMMRLSVLVSQDLLKERAPSDSVTTSDSKIAAVGKLLAEAASATDLAAKSLIAARAESVTASESADIHLLKALSDAASATAVADAAVREITKTLSDSVNALDDVDAASADDNQTIQFIKVMSEAITTADVLILTLQILRTFNEPVSTSDSIVNHFTKSLADVVTTLDIIGVGGSNQIQTDSTALTDIALLLLSKVLSDSISAADVVLSTLGKALTESVPITDASTKTVQKIAAENLTATDTGNIFKDTGYVSEDYFAERYVGFEINF